MNGFVSAVGEYRLNLSSGQSVNITVSGSNPCGSANRTFTFTTSSGGWRLASANPATDAVIVEFDNPNQLEALPDQVDLLSGESTKPVKSVNIKEVYEKKAFKDGNKIQFDVQELPRGVYYLQVKNSREKDKGKQVESIRILLE